MPDILAATLRSLAFLTRLPPVSRAFSGVHPLGSDAHAFPLAGLVAALPSALAVLLFGAFGLSPSTIAILAIALLVAVTGGLHEDGLSDVADGLGGHHPKDRALEIMKDSRIGAYGALALVLSLMLRASLLADIVATGTGQAALALLAAAAASRGAMAWLWSSLPSARDSGVAARVGQPSARSGRIAAFIGATLLVIAGAIIAGLAGAVLPLLAGLLVLGQFRKFLVRRLGGQTGDCVGAAQQITEIAALLGLALALG
ncbi:adenosylcobinamide-GDP ribazoletransferase [Aureimonas sp. SA4125]|uniref:adenosylcobinamide-GDP ribazoletransferase n=1 Tax=Aureimonas sp. SA4125 TaxID=2826993 RepID=UPI001CC5C91E|nr:adenosylcobinamide-GDP ribazoletransferase [Aureimonas sp. SA4125]BDA82598.1 adenosylcobinamide-GDP ribazoletransferase [Aureimonas sp. SA4125]